MCLLLPHVKQTCRRILTHSHNRTHSSVRSCNDLPVMTPLLCYGGAVCACPAAINSRMHTSQHQRTHTPDLSQRQSYNHPQRPNKSTPGWKGHHLRQSDAHLVVKVGVTLTWCSVQLDDPAHWLLTLTEKLTGRESKDFSTSLRLFTDF